VCYLQSISSRSVASEDTLKGAIQAIIVIAGVKKIRGDTNHVTWQRCQQHNTFITHVGASSGVYLQPKLTR
jgi:hypothetical protein